MDDIKLAYLSSHFLQKTFVFLRLLENFCSTAWKTSLVVNVDEKKSCERKVRLPHKNTGTTRVRVIMSSHTNIPKWFKFEKDVESLMSKLGFSIYEKSSRNDGGIDVLATRQTGNIAESYAVKQLANHSIGEDVTGGW